MRKNERTDFDEVKKLINAFVKNKYLSTIVILKLIKIKFELTDKEFQKSLQSFLENTSLTWTDPSCETIDFLNQISSSFRPYQFRHQVHENQSTYADCVETAMRNFLAIIVSLKPKSHSNDLWFKELGIDHIFSNLDNSKSLFETLEGPDTDHKHTEFASILRKQNSFFPQRRENGCIVSENRLFEHLENLLKTDPLDLLKKCSLPFEANIDSTSLTIYQSGEAIQFDNGNVHANVSVSKNIIPSFFLTLLDPETVNEIMPILLLSYPQKELKATLLSFWERSSGSQFIPIFQNWKQLIDVILGPESNSIYHRILLLSDEKKEFLLQVKQDGETNIYRAYRVVSLNGNAKKHYTETKLLGFSNEDSLKIAEMNDVKAQYVLEAKALNFDDGDNIRILSEFTAGQIALAFKARQDGFSSGISLHIARSDSFHDKCYKIKNIGIGPDLAGRLADFGNDEITGLANKSKEIGLKEEEFIDFALKNKETPKRIEIALNILKSGKSRGGNISPDNVMKIVNFISEWDSSILTDFINMIGKIDRPILNDLLAIAWSIINGSLDAISDEINHGFSGYYSILVFKLNGDQKKRAYNAKEAYFADEGALEVAKMTASKASKAMKAKKAKMSDSECIALSQKSRFIFELAIRRKRAELRREMRQSMIDT